MNGSHILGTMQEWIGTKFVPEGKKYMEDIICKTDQRKQEGKHWRDEK